MKQYKFMRQMKSFDKVSNNQYDPTLALSDRSALSFGKGRNHSKIQDYQSMPQ